jgi:hypothetical protein
MPHAVDVRADLSRQLPDDRDIGQRWHLECTLRRPAQGTRPEPKGRSGAEYGVVPMWRVGPYDDSRYIENKI